MTTTTDSVWQPLATSTEERWSRHGAHAGRTHVIRLAHPRLLHSFVVVYVFAAWYDDMPDIYVSYCVARQVVADPNRPDETERWSDVLEGDLTVSVDTTARAEHMAHRAAYLVHRGGHASLCELDAAFAAAISDWDGAPYSPPEPHQAPTVPIDR